MTPALDPTRCARDKRARIAGLCKNTTRITLAQRKARDAAVPARYFWPFVWSGYCWSLCCSAGDFQKCWGDRKEAAQLRWTAGEWTGGCLRSFTAVTFGGEGCGESADVCMLILRKGQACLHGANQPLLSARRLSPNRRVRPGRSWARLFICMHL